jgi:hypothetical protein
MPIIDLPVGRQDTALRLRLVMPRHMAADLSRVGTLGGHFLGDPAFVHHDDPIREFEDLVQDLGDRRTAVPALRAAMTRARVSATAFTSRPKHGLATITSRTSRAIALRPSE